MKTVTGDVNVNQRGIVKRSGKIAIEDTAGWVLRIGVVLSVTTMLIGLIISFAHGDITVNRIESTKFHFAHLVSGLATLDGYAIIELGVLLLVLTPIMRVAASVVLFAVEERDWTYTVFTLIVFVLTLSSLLLLR